MSLSRFLLATSVLAAGCGDDGDRCGPAGAPGTGLVASGTATTLTFGGLHAGANGDCPAAGAPTGLSSLTIAGSQTDGTGFVTMCVPRPDLLADQAQTVTVDRANTQGTVILEDVTGGANNCTYAIDRTQPATGTLSASGLCGDGIDPAGFAAVVDASLTLKRTCGATVDSVAITLRGRVAVSPE
jgi:hypothetical protein